MFSQIRKRSGNLEDFSDSKINLAIEKAFLATKVPYSQEDLDLLTHHAVSYLHAKFMEEIPSVEAVQDIVEETLATRGYFNVSKAYILYRHERAKVRGLKLEEVDAAMDHWEVINSSKKAVKFSKTLLKRSIKQYASGFNEIDTEKVLKNVISSCFNGMTTKEVQTALVFGFRSFIEDDQEYSKAASRVLLNSMYKSFLGITEFDNGFLKAYKEGFITFINSAVEQGKISPDMTKFDLAALSEKIDPSRDSLLAYLGSQILADRYYLKNRQDVIIELPQYFWMRVAMGISHIETNAQTIAEEFYEIVSSLRYVPSTPTLLHSATLHPQLSSCYLTTIDDDLHHIFKCIGDNAQLSKWSGGIGNDWSNIRATGAMVNSIGVTSQGVIPYMKVADSTTAAINRSGKRRGATVAYLETWHYDIESFLELRKNTGDDRRRTHDMNTSNWIPDLFMRRVEEDGDWTLFSPEEVSDLHHIYGLAFKERYEHYELQAQQGKIRLHKTLKARTLWKKMLTMLFETGHPWITFKDPCNLRSPQSHQGVVHSSNLCTEITLNTSANETAVCNLGSVNLARHVVDGKLDTELLDDTVIKAMRLLDNVVDINFYPTIEAQNSNLAHRPVGLGVMGFQDALYKLKLDFESAQAIALSSAIMERISYNAILSSSMLAKEKGKYSSYNGSKWSQGIFPQDTIAILEAERGMSTETVINETLDWSQVRAHVKEHGMRNSNCMAIAPTATIANIAGCFPSIEPIYKNIYTKSNFSGEFMVVNSYLIEELKSRKLWNDDMLRSLKYYDGSLKFIKELPTDIKEIYKEVFEISQISVLKHAQARGIWIDQSQSLNIFLNTTSGKILDDIYMTAWKLGLKTTYYLRSLGASSIEKSTLEKSSIRLDEPVEISDVFVGKACLMDDPTCEACQ